MLRKSPRCQACKQPFTKTKPLQVVCDSTCAMVLAEVKKKKAQAKRDREQRRDTKVRLMELKPLAYFIKETQKVFNQWIRFRDAGLPCISCGTTANVQYAAGHYRTTAAAPQHRFNPDNVFSQCNRNCNLEKSGNCVEMRKGMIDRIGVRRVEAVENDNKTRKWTREDLKALKGDYTQRLKVKINE